ncbi:MAG: hypothetical protein OEZ01_17000 [Candidatus Heimdallarchaeota archaeon]|nr:hypothetical protein [Candidatus Heimdallarchaeota archaeon]MDH5647713.1 hypothetical protein [Candidatus Heimdallarchaeota archaeon]
MKLFLINTPKKAFLFFFLSVIINQNVNKYIFLNISDEVLITLSEGISTNGDIEVARQILARTGSFWISILIMLKWLALTGYIFMVLNNDELENEFSLKLASEYSSKAYMSILLSASIRLWLITYYSPDYLFQQFFGNSIGYYIGLFGILTTSIMIVLVYHFQWKDDKNVNNYIILFVGPIFMELILIIGNLQ